VETSRHPQVQRRREIAQTAFSQYARIGRALASPARLMLVDLLCQGPRNVEALAQEAGLSVANTSQHLQHLRAATLVDIQRDGQRVIYRIASDEVSSFYAGLRSLAAIQLAELARLRRELGAEEREDTEAILRRIERDDVTLVDVRPAIEFVAGHLAGAVSIPVDELPRRLHEIPRTRDVIAYCRGPFCVLADEAVELLLENGYRAEVLRLGVPELRGRRIPLVRSAAEPARAAGPHAVKRARVRAR
jgi:rhodanese-related sulfurtransferase/predicted transcriptional regulator